MAETLEEAWARIQGELRAGQPLEGQIAMTPTGTPVQREQQRSARDAHNRGVRDKETLKRIVAESEPATMAQSVAGSVGTFPEDRLAYYRRVAGEGGEIMDDRQGGVVIRRADGRRIHIPKSRLPDIAEGVVGAVPSAAATASGVGLGAAVGLGGAGAGLANMTRQRVAQDIASADTGPIKKAMGASVLGTLINPVLGVPAAAATYLGAERQPSDVSGGDRLAQAGVATAVGAAGELVPGLITKGAGAAMRRMSPQGQAASVLMQRGPDAPSLFGPNVKSAFEAGKAIENAARKLDPDFYLTASQLTGSREVASVERVLKSTPGLMDRSAVDAAKQSAAYGRTLDAILNKAAKNPDALGDSELGPRAVRAAQGYIDNGWEALRAMEGPLYKQAHEAAGGRRVVQMRRFLDEGEAILEGSRADPGALGRLRSIVRNVGAYATDSGRATLNDYHTARKAIGLIAAGKTRLGTTLTPDASKAIGAKLLAALDEDLEASAKGIAAGEAAGAMSRALKVGREGRRALGAAREQLDVILGGNNPDAVVDRIAGMSDGAAKNLISLTDQISPELGADIRAATLKKMFAKGGFGRDLPYKAELPVRGGSPGALRKSMSDNAGLLRVLYPDGGAIARDLQTAIDAAGRMEAIGGTAGSDTVQNHLATLSTGILRRVTSEGSFLKAGQQVVAEQLGKMFSNPDTLYAALSSPDALRAFSAAAKMAYQPGAFSRASAATFAASLRSLAMAGVITSRRTEIDWRPQVESEQ